MEEVIVTGAQVVMADTAVGPNAIFDIATLQDSPAINRNINDIIQQDPRLFVDQSRGSVDAVQCNGANPRYNSLTVDGVRLNDGFGLNSNGYPTQRMPFPYDAISSVAVEMAPMSVVYGGFSACNINAVTKTGRNDIYGSAFFDYGSDELRGDKLEGDNIAQQDYSETRYGFELGGALIEDKLFFYGAYEKYEGADLNNRGAIGSGAVNEVPVTQAELDRIAQIARDVYGYEPGRTVSEAFDFDDEKYLIKLDWYASDTQRLSMTYMYNDSFNFTPYLDGDLDEFEFDKHFYKRGAELTTYNINWYADWSENFSTEVRYSYNEVDFLQASVSGLDFGEFRIELDEVDVYLGQDTIAVKQTISTGKLSSSLLAVLTSGAITRLPSVTSVIPQTSSTCSTSTLIRKSASMASTISSKVTQRVFTTAMQLLTTKWMPRLNGATPSTRPTSKTSGRSRQTFA